MDNIKLYEINSIYIDYLVPFAPHLFRNRKQNQQNERKYIGVVFHINGLDYFAPLSSFKAKHTQMKESIDFLKIKNYAVINLNNMFPVPLSECSYVDINKVKDMHYKALLLAEYRYIKSIQEKIRKNAATVYNHKIKNGNSTALAKRCNDFSVLEKACIEYKK
ncbi:MAG: type III toxin-antitoxin system ToxN/AbiQ family toxin [Clostridia bacterium]|nr:type III toxin-antitoxin system ToxN/AbiQ family toxin [Clostridia bacterium]